VRQLGKLLSASGFPAIRKAWRILVRHMQEMALSDQQIGLKTIKSSKL
jgi:hypothetical protein